MAVSGSVFKCGNCGAAVADAVPGQVMACPYCGAQQVFPMPSLGVSEIKGTVIIQGGLKISGGGMVIQGGGLVIKGGGSDFKSNEVLHCSMSDSAHLFVPGQGFFVVGLHGDEDETPQRKLRCIEACGRKVVWEVDGGFAKLEGENLKLSNGRVYASAEGILRCFDLAGGSMLWQTRLPDELESNGREGLELLDPAPADAPQAVLLAHTKDEKVVAIDRATGQPRWQVPEDGFWYDPMFAGFGLITSYFSSEDTLRLINPLAGPQPVATVHMGHSPVGYSLLGNQLVVGSSDTVAVIELPSARVLFQGAVGEDMFDYDCGLPAVAGGLIWVAADEALSGYPKGKAVRGPLLPGHKITCLGSTGDTLLAAVRKDPGTPKQALLAFDPATLQPRYAQQEVGKYDEDRWGPRHVRQIPCSAGFALVLGEGAEVDGNDMTDLFGVHAATGAVAWKVDLPGEVDRTDVVAGYFQVRTRHQVLLVRPDNGQRIGKFPWND